MGFCNTSGSIKKQITAYDIYWLKRKIEGEREEKGNLFEGMKEGALLYRESASSSSFFPSLLG